ncbi:MAG: hypothetical protein QOH81_767 [Sphingomonadales bacterium]|nr:hypothetical protein [Sphingomonadales bacterium]
MLLFMAAGTLQAKPTPAMVLGYIVELNIPTSDEPAARAALAASQQALVAKLARRGVSATIFSTLPYMYVTRLTAKQLAELRREPEVRAVTRERVFSKSVAQSLPLIGQPRAVAAGATGNGFSVAVLDSGVDYRFPEFGACSAPGPACRVSFAKDFAPEDGAPDQGTKHGTNVAAIVARVAPQSKILALDIFQDESSLEGAIIGALSWVNQNKAAYSVGAVNLSIQGPVSTTPCSNDPLRTAIKTLTDAGIAVVISSGNEARKDGLARPSCIPEAISVGATTDARIPATNSPTCNDPVLQPDSVPCFSNSASFLTLLAPGHAITAGPGTMSGTSQAAPHVAGAIVALRSAKAGRTSAEALAMLKASGVPVKDRNAVTKPRISLGAATNVPPLARDDSGEALEGGGAVVAALANDSDEDPTTLVPALIDPPVGISARVVRQKLYILTAPGTAGTKALRYRITDNYGASAEARITLTVRAAAMPAAATLSTGRTFAVSSVATDSQRLVQWIEQRAGTIRVWQREVTASGAPSGSELALSVAGASVVTSDLVASASGSSHTVAWLQTIGAMPGQKTKIFSTTHVFPQLGKPIQASFADAAPVLANPSVVVLPAGPVVFWNRPLSTMKVYNQAYSGGVVPVPEGQVLTLQPSVDVDAWKTMRITDTAYMLFYGTGGGVSAQRFNAQAVSSWPGPRPLVDATSGKVLQFDPAPVPAGLALLWAAIGTSPLPDISSSATTWTAPRSGRW